MKSGAKSRATRQLTVSSMQASPRAPAPGFRLKVRVRVLNSFFIITTVRHFKWDT